MILQLYNDRRAKCKRLHGQPLLEMCETASRIARIPLAASAYSKIEAGTQAVRFEAFPNSGR